MKKAILYTRVAFSYQNEKLNRLEEQAELLKAYCIENNISIEGIYSDVASGKTFDREGFKKAIQDLKNGNINPGYVLFTEWYRLSTDIKQTVGKYKEFEKNGIELKAIMDDEKSEAFLKIINNK